MRRAGIKPLALALAVLFMASALVCGFDLGSESHLGSHSGDSCLFLGPGGTVGVISLPSDSLPAIPMTVIAFLTLTFIFSVGPYSGRAYQSTPFQTLSSQQRLAYVQTFLS